MSKRSEEVYPRMKGSDMTTFSLNKKNELRREGYEQAEQDTIERAIKWLKENASNYIVNCTESCPDAPFKATIGGKCWEDLKEVMKKDNG